MSIFRKREAIPPEEDPKFPAKPEIPALNEYLIIWNDGSQEILQAHLLVFDGNRATLKDIGDYEWYDYSSRFFINLWQEVFTHYRHYSLLNMRSIARIYKEE